MKIQNHLLTTVKSWFQLTHPKQISGITICEKFAKSISHFNRLTFHDWNKLSNCPDACNPSSIRMSLIISKYM